MRHAIWLACLLATTTANAQIYKKILPDGTVIFTDQPEEGATALTLPPLPTYDGPATTNKPAPSPAAEKPAKTAEPAAKVVTYTRLAIEQPANDSPVRNNSGEVTVAVTLEPALSAKDGHTIVVLLDGKPAAAPAAATSITLQGVERGTHVVEAVVNDANGKALQRSSPVIFHLQRVSVR
jgi:hypothetical protein